MVHENGVIMQLDYKDTLDHLLLVYRASKNPYHPERTRAEINMDWGALLDKIAL